MYFSSRPWLAPTLSVIVDRFRLVGFAEEEKSASVATAWFTDCLQITLQCLCCPTFGFPTTDE